MLQVLGRATSINVRKVLWVCHELEITYELQEWGSGNLAIDTPGVPRAQPERPGAGHPRRRFVLWESNTICRYLASSARAAPICFRWMRASGPAWSSGWTGRQRS